MKKPLPEPTFRCILDDGTHSALMTWSRLVAEADLLTSRGVRRVEAWFPEPLPERPLHGEWREVPLTIPGLILSDELDEPKPAA